MTKKIDPGKAPNKKSNRVDPEIQIPIAYVAMDHLIKELELLEALYDAADFTEVVLEDPKNEKGKSQEQDQYVDWLTKGRFFKAVSERNRAIQSQYIHIKTAAQAASGCIHPPGHNTESEREASAKTVEELTKRVADKKANWEENKRKLKAKVDADSETLRKEEEEAAVANLLEL